MNILRYGLCFFLVLATCLCSADEPVTLSPDEGITLETRKTTTEKYQQNQTYTNDSVFKFSWELQTYGEKYPIARTFLWAEPNAVGDAGGYVAHTRDKDGGDTYELGGYAALRPFALDFGTYSFAIGFSFSLYSFKFESPDTLDIAADPTTGGIITTSTDGNKGYLFLPSYSLSILGSFPTVGVQTVFDVGITTARLRVDSRSVVGRLVDPTTGTVIADQIYDDYTYKQRTNMINLAFTFSKFFERNYFNLLTFTVSAYLPVRRIDRDSRAQLRFNGNVALDGGRQDLPGAINTLFGPIPYPDLNQAGSEREADDVEASFVAGSVGTRLISVPIDIPGIGNNLPISIDAIGSVFHLPGELLGANFHGTGWTLGGQLSLFDVIGLGVYRTWYFENDLSNDLQFVINVGLYGGFTGPKDPSEVE